MIAEITHIARRPEFRRRIVFIEDYDINVARYLAQGVDIWLNNPRRPLEASGTSGMKACCNGAINLSILDGWWCEGYANDNGWAIGAGEEYSDLNYQDDVESRAIYDLMEQEIVPLFYQRSSDGLPRGWVKVMKRAMSTVGPVFNTNRMVQEYVERCYATSAERHDLLTRDNLQKATELAKWRHALANGWSNVAIEKVQSNEGDPLRVGGRLDVDAYVNLGPLSPDDVQVQLFHGRVDNLGTIPKPHTINMSHNGAHESNGAWHFKGTIPCRSSGQHGFSVRVLPNHPDLGDLYEPGLVCWG